MIGHKKLTKPQHPLSKSTLFTTIPSFNECDQTVYNQLSTQWFTPVYYQLFIQQGLRLVATYYDAYSDVSSFIDWR